MTAIVPVLMAGGSGTRLWPLSRTQYPKQFIRLIDDEHSMLQSTLLRARAIPESVDPLVIGNEDHRFIMAQQMQEIGLSKPNVVLEPEGRNTAPVAAMAAQFAAENYGSDSVVILMAADQTIADTDAFVASVLTGKAVAEAGHLVTFGIQPSSPQTGYGYLKAGKALEGKLEGATKVAGFFEKPTREKAEQYLAEGNFFWNGGIFMFTPKTFLAELDALEPEMGQAAAESLQRSSRDLDFIRLDAESFAKCRAESVDYAVMERTDNIALVPLDAGWDDVGSWTYMSNMPATDKDGNRARGNVVFEDAKNNVVHTGNQLVALLGVENQVVVATEDAILVTRKDMAQNVGKLAKRLLAENRQEAAQRTRVNRPWGFYETVAMDDRFQVKRIQVAPAKKLSLQMHHHRAEHWIVVRGTAKVTCDDKTYLLTEDQSTYIPLGKTHRVENPGKVPLEMIEVQSGSYLGEDDIVRFEDDFNRVK